MTRRPFMFAVLALALISGVVQAQDYLYTTFQLAHRDYVLPPAPCFSPHPTQPMVYDGSAWMVYTCADGTTIARRFFHPIDSSHTSGEGARVPAPTPVGGTPVCATVKPGLDWACVNGGWLPPGR